ncbi:MAG: aminotransferase class III-fold pyridoxal phosphate-dependent enzyme, partial [Candidatus Bathyarchaeota archaeon]
VKSFMHYSYTDFRYREPVELAERLNKILPMKCRYFFASGGTEANEAAIKIARHHTKKHMFIGFMGSFHGRTAGTMPFSSSAPSQRRHFYPLMPGVTLTPYAYCYRCPFKLEYPNCNLWCVDFIEKWLFKRFVPPENTVGFLFEPIQGENGYVVPPPEFFPRLKKLADKYNLLMIDDEIQVGMGRTGKFLAIEHWNVIPDIVSLGKGIAGGIPLSIAAGRREVLDLPPGAHCTTTGGNPVACTAAQATLDVLFEEKLMDKSAELGDYTMKRLKEMQDQYNIIGDVRGKGLAIAVEFVKNRKTKEPASTAAKDIIEKMFKSGVVMVTGGVSSVRIAPPLVIPKELMDTGLEIFESAIEQVDKAYYKE